MEIAFWRVWPKKRVHVKIFVKIPIFRIYAVPIHNVHIIFGGYKSSGFLFSDPYRHLDIQTDIFCKYYRTYKSSGDLKTDLSTKTSSSMFRPKHRKSVVFCSC